MKSIVAGLIGFSAGAIGGYFVGSYAWRKISVQQKKEQEEIELFYAEQIEELGERIKAVEAKAAQKTYKVDDDEEVEVLNDDEWEEVDDDDNYKVVVEKVSGNTINVAKNKIHPVYHDEAIELINSHKAEQVEVWLFSDGILADENKEREIKDANKIIGYDILNRLAEIDADAYDGESMEEAFPYFVYNENNSTVYEILKDNRTFKEYIATISG